MKWELIEPSRGDIIRAKAGPIYHYGIYVSDDEIIQFGVTPLLRRGVPNDEIAICATDVSSFLCGAFLEVGVAQGKERKTRRSPDETVEAARARLGETGYHLLYNNCEHFAYECATGEKYCSQTENVRQLFRNMSTTDVYVAAIPDGKLGKVVPAARQEQIDQTTHEGLKRQRYFVWKLLEYALERSFGYKMKKMTFERDERGKWRCDECYFSLSHTDGAVAVAVSRTPVGVDIESTKRVINERAEEKILTSRERETFAALDEERRATYLLERWSAKESLFKRSDDAVFRPSAIETDREVYIGRTTVGDERYQLTVATGDVNKLKFLDPVKW
ncbi:MAG: lecithin retinol acyltransferase family protein [Clostridia bacterium]|nr:lecithin retinol acyltransferase family protein [Clostridia bacterium]